MIIVAVRECDTIPKKKRKKKEENKKKKYIQLKKKKLSTLLPDDDDSLLSRSLQCQTAAVQRPLGLDMQGHYSAHPEYKGAGHFLRDSKQKFVLFRN